MDETLFLLHFLASHINSHTLSFTNRMNGFAGANPRRRMPLDKQKQGPTVVHQKPGPLQTIFNLLPDEVRIMNPNLHKAMFIAFL